MTETLEMFSNMGGELVPKFGGVTYEPKHDEVRLTGQLARVRDCMADGLWRTLDEIKAVTGDQTQAISARLRDLRKIRFGMHTVERRRRGEPSLGIWEYRVTN